MAPIFLHGGGDDVQCREATFGRFVRALPAGHGGPLLLVIAEPDEADRAESLRAYASIFQAVGLSADELAPAFVAPGQPLTAEGLAELRPRGIFVCGGATPFYHTSLCAPSHNDWVGYLRATGIPFGGTSAGAALAAEGAILGGWRAERAGASRPILFKGAGEGLDELSVREGLGLVPFSVDVHASQWGTLLRLVHAVELGLTPGGWAIDEDTLLEVEGAEVRVFGRGQAYEVRPLAGGGVGVRIHPGA